MKTVHQKDDFDCGVAAVAMLLCGTQRLSREIAYDLARKELDTTKRTRIGQLKEVLDKLGRPLRARNMAAVPEGGLPNLARDALVLVQFHGNGSKHWMVWDHRRQKLLDPDKSKQHFSSFQILRQIEVTT